MTGRIPALRAAGAASAGVVLRLASTRAGAPLLFAFAAGGAALIAPPLALIIVAFLASRVLFRTEPKRIDLAALAGPLFAALIVGAFVGLEGAIGVLFAWRLFVDTRWSVNEAQRLAIAAGRPAETSFSALAHAWLTPIYGLTLVAYTAPHMVAGLPLDLPHLPSLVVMIAGALALVATADWMLRRAADWRLGELAKAPAAHLLTHHALFLAAFGLSIDISAGLVALLAWRLSHAAPLRVAQPSLTAVP
ncbi:hypothetical protein [Terricaulis sp.]|uniref:hypothetical protein n=1 Tax=Terricaulis sp. TaxID=2768686 RepID=UPI003783C156